MARLCERLLHVGLLLVVLSACSLTEETGAPVTPIVHASGRIAPNSTAVYLVPGVLTPKSIFGPALDWGDAQRSVWVYRFPGYDDRPLKGDVNIERAADTIVRHAAALGAERVVIVGVSTGASIAIEAGARMTAQDVTIAGISPAVPFPGMLLAGFGSSSDVAQAFFEAGALTFDSVWRRYYPTLLLGRDWSLRSDKRARAERLMKNYEQETFVRPSDGVGASHVSNLLVWNLSEAALKSRARHVFWHGADDTISPLPRVRKLASRLGAALHVIPGVGHLPLEVDDSLWTEIESGIGLRHP